MGDIPHQEYEMTRKCWRKRGMYPTAKLARKYARKIFKKSGDQFYPYLCSGCGQWHLTKNPDAKGKTL